MVVEFAPVELHGHCSGRNSNRDEHRAQENDMVVAVAIRESLQADGIQQHQRGLDEFTAIGIGQINHSTHHESGHGGGVVSDVVVDPR